MKLMNFIGPNKRTFLFIITISILIYLMLAYNFDIRAITIITLVLGYITNIYAGIISLVGLIPFVGPLIIKVLTIPFFWLMNGFGYLTSIYAIRKGYGKQILSHRLVTIILLIGIILGYILGHLVPVR